MLAESWKSLDTSYIDRGGAPDPSMYIYDISPKLTHRPAGKLAVLFR